MGRVPVRLREVVYTVSPFEVTILNGLVKDFPGKVMRHLTEKGPNIAFWCVGPIAAIVWYAEDFKEKEKLGHRY